MKNLFTQILVLIATAFTFQGCFSLDFAGRGGQSINTKKFIEEKNYEQDQPFVMKDHGINAPLISQKGQVNFNAKINNGLTTDFTVAVSDKIFVEGGMTYAIGNDSYMMTGTFEANENKYQNNATIFFSTQRYEKMVQSKNLSFFAGVGMYKTFGKNGRWENHAGISYGNASTNYSYAFNSYHAINYSFGESRKYGSLFAQSDFGYVTKKTEGAIIARASWINYFDQSFKEQSYIDTYKMKNSQILIQPGLQFAYGGNFRVFTQLSWNIPVGSSEVKWFSSNCKFGILLKFGEKVQG